MSNGNDDRPLARWTTGNLIGLLGFISLIVSAWVNLNGRVSVLEAENGHSNKQQDSMDRKLDLLLQEQRR